MPTDRTLPGKPTVMKGRDCFFGKGPCLEITDGDIFPRKLGDDFGHAVAADGRGVALLAAVLLLAVLALPTTGLARRACRGGALWRLPSRLPCRGVPVVGLATASIGDLLPARRKAGACWRGCSIAATSTARHCRPFTAATAARRSTTCGTFAAARPFGSTCGTFSASPSPVWLGPVAPVTPAPAGRLPRHRTSTLFGFLL